MSTEQKLPSARGKLNLRDLTRGVLFAAVMSGLTSAYKIYEHSGFNFTSHDWETILKVAAGTFMTKLMIAFSTDGEKTKRRAVRQAIEKGEVKPLQTGEPPIDRP